MTNKEIARTFQFLGNIMELHGENPFKIRSYQNAYRQLRALSEPLNTMTDEQIGSIKGVGSAIQKKIRELLETGEMQTLEKYKDQTPEGVQELLTIKGLGPKKLRVIWKELEVESVGELLYAVNENRLLDLKGFGAKTQEDLRQKLEYYLNSQHLYHYAKLEEPAQKILDRLQSLNTGVRIATSGALRRGSNTLEEITLLAVDHPNWMEWLSSAGLKSLNQVEGEEIIGATSEDIPVRILLCKEEEFANRWLETSSSDDFKQALDTASPKWRQEPQTSEAAIFSQAGLPFVPPSLREDSWGLDWCKTHDPETLLQESDIRGVVHAHTTYSDGLHSLREMVEYAQAQGYEYLTITDHSKSAFYANGLQPDRVRQQWEEIDQLQKEYPDFRILKGIESDILMDGSLDYEEELLKGFDVVIASVHAHLRMDEEKATSRLVKAIENPYTHILGHPTGRLLLSRKGYPIDHQRVIDACAANGVAIELNANPYRLDLDWSWIPVALDKGVLISINPDAHSQQGIHDIHFGVISARKGGLTKAQCLNACSASDFLAHLR
jgi:DNA polymerase (family 10)